MAKVSPGTETKAFPIHAKLTLLLQLVNSNFTERETTESNYTAKDRSWKSGTQTARFHIYDDIVDLQILLICYFIH